MPDLDQAIADWREQMSAGGINSPEVLDELESHLRDHAEEQMRSGLNAGEAFRVAVRRIGQAPLLKSEFDKVGEPGETVAQRLKRAIFILASIQNPTLLTNMNASYSTTNIEPRWATYFKAAAFLAPAVILWLFSAVFMFPKLQQICRNAGVAVPTVYQFVNFITAHGFVICGGLLLTLFLLEWRSRKWPQYRRATVGTAVFVLNSAILILITLMAVLAVMAAPALAHHAK